MHRLAKISAVVVLSLLVASAAALAWVDLVFVAPEVSKARDLIAQASATERRPPLHLVRLLETSDGGKMRKSALVRRLLYLEPSQVHGLRTTRRQLVELGITALIGWHLDEHELLAARLASAYLGARAVGFERAAGEYFSMPLEQLSREQFAELVALERAPTAMRTNPAQLKRIKQHLLDRTT